MARDTHLPAYRAYSVIEREGQDDFWQPLGAAFPHQDGRGFNLVLQALPLDGKIVLREPQENEQSDAAGAKPDNVTEVGGYRNRRRGR